ncbi:hypothetical protein KPH14_012586 [Odynerus spinipes]|uniref:Uncharacterized protein n=1 Tax=Odynerus spinipes TaxID=1348599 RepID=A0AAD9VKU0_9HYME|nr:hypothetical protein KPH14_012586 [Odynerus spinipes]
MKFLPNPVETLEPQRLKPMSHPTWKYLTPGSLASSGIYTEKEIEELREHIMFPVEKSAVLNTFARGYTGQDIDQETMSLYHLMDEQTLDKIAQSTMGKIWDGFMTFGSISAGILMIFVILFIIKTIADAIIRGIAMHSAYGCSIYLFAALWDSIATLLLQRAPKTQNKDETAPSEDESRGTNATPNPIRTTISFPDPSIYASPIL